MKLEFKPEDFNALGGHEPVYVNDEDFNMVERSILASRIANARLAVMLEKAPEGAQNQTLRDDLRECEAMESAQRAFAEAQLTINQALRGLLMEAVVKLEAHDHPPINLIKRIDAALGEK